jgi:hypothetical protein
MYHRTPHAVGADAVMLHSLTLLPRAITLMYVAVSICVLLPDIA